MSACVYYRKGFCACAARCLYKDIERDGKISCRRDGSLGAKEITSAEYGKGQK